jgi:hypothetical protein
MKTNNLEDIMDDYNNSSSGQVIIQPIYTNGWVMPYIFPNDFTVAPTEPADTKKKEMDGCFCKKCHNFYEYAEPNQYDGTLICWACRNGW